MTSAYHADEARFLDAIRAAPDDDLPRLVYADWLSERGDPRGESVVAQCTRARCEAAGDFTSDICRRAVVAEAVLVDSTRNAWRAWLGVPDKYRSSFWRGLTCTIETTAALLAEQWPSLARVPFRTLHLDGSIHVRALQDVAALPGIDQLGAIELGAHGSIHTLSASKLVAAPPHPSSRSSAFAICQRSTSPASTSGGNASRR